MDMAARPAHDPMPATRERVTRAALQRFADGGYAATSLREIARSVGVTVPALYYHFASKEDLLSSIVRPFLSAADDFLEELASQPRAGFARRALAGYYDLIVEHLDVYRLVSSDPAVRGHAEVGQWAARQEETLLELLAGTGADHGRRVRAAAATGALRRPLRLPDIDPVRDRELIVSAALGALGTEVVALSTVEGAK
jgi:AcrR family transcriptional regulator